MHVASAHTHTHTHTEAEKVAEVTKIQYDRKIMEKEKQKKMSEIDDSANLARMTAQADADFYKIQRQAEANKVGSKVIGLFCLMSESRGGSTGSLGSIVMKHSLGTDCILCIFDLCTLFFLFVFVLLGESVQLACEHACF